MPPRLKRICPCLSCHGPLRVNCKPVYVEIIRAPPNLLTHSLTGCKRDARRGHEEGGTKRGRKRQSAAISQPNVSARPVSVTKQHALLRSLRYCPDWKPGRLQPRPDPPRRHQHQEWQGEAEAMAGAASIACQRQASPLRTASGPTNHSSRYAGGRATAQSATIAVQTFIAVPQSTVPRRPQAAEGRCRACCIPAANPGLGRRRPGGSPPDSV